MTGVLLGRCTFPPAGTDVVAGVSGGVDSTALLALAVEAGCRVTAVHVDHGLRAGSGAEAGHVARLAERLGAGFRSERVTVRPGPNLEARAREARLEALGPGAMTGHTADDQAETVLLRLLRGSGLDGLAGMRPGPTKPILGLRRRETRGLCTQLGLPFLDDPSNADPAFRRNRVRSEVLPLLDDVADRDAGALLARAAGLLEEDARLLDELAGAVDPTIVASLRAAPAPLARRAVRRWLAVGGYPPDLATVERVLAVARGDALAAEVGAGRRVRRSKGRLLLESPATIPMR
ncbi:MAG: tRNA lysidine(34) synthetase TilS [Acidimicrobiia bacterium]